jgi:DNA-directed RNA polymerase specialized sigma24 family protein
VIGRRGATLDELEALYRRRFDVFARLAASVTGDFEGARDVVQEAFATAVRKRGSFRGEGPLEAWVWRIVLNAARSDQRRQITAVDFDYDEPAAANGHPERDGELRARSSRACRSGSESPSSSATTRTSTTWRSARRLGSAPEPSPRP